MTTRSGRAVRAVVPAVVLSAGVLAACDGPDVARARPGDQYEAVAGHVTARTVSLRTPQGRLDARAGTPRTRITEVGTGTPLAAPSGGRFVPVEIDQGPAAATAIVGSDAAGTTVTDAFPTMRLTLLADGRRYAIDQRVLLGAGDDGLADPDEIADAQRSGDLPYGATYIAVRGVPTRLALEVQLEGTTQQVDLRTGARRTGGAAALYADPRPSADHPCGRVTAPRGIVPGGASCLIGWTRTGWLGGRGLAPPGRAWVIARVGIDDPYLLTIRGVDADVDTDPILRYRYSGGPALVVQRRDPNGHADLDPSVALSVPAQPSSRASGTLTITATYRLTGSDGSTVTRGRPVVLTWRTAIR